MKVLLVNGSPHEKGCTYTALNEVAETLNHEGIDTEIFQIGTKPLAGCIACKSCVKTGHCVFDDKVNEFLEIAGDFDGYIFGSPVHFAAASGAITSFMDRVFYADLCSGKQSFYLKPAAAVVSARRAGTTATFDQLNKYFTLMADANYFFTVLEYGTRSNSRRCEKGYRRASDYAYLRQKYGILLKMQRSWNKSRYCFPRKGKNYIHKFHSVKEVLFYDDYRSK